MITLAIANAPSANTTFWQRGTTTWEEVCSWVEHPRTDGSKDGPGYVLGTLSSNRRTRDTVIERGVIALDADHLTPRTQMLLLDRLHMMNCAALVYSTFSSTAAAPRLRLLILPDRPLTPEEYWLAAGGLMRSLGLDMFDPGSQQHERLMYMPSVAPGQAFFSRVIEGPPLGMDSLLEAIDLIYTIPPRDATAEPPAVQPHLLAGRPLPEHIIKDQVASALRALDALAALPESARHPWPGVPGGLGWDLGMLYMAERLIEAANSGGSYTLEQAQADFIAHAPPLSVDHKWSEALTFVGTKPIPYEHPEDVFDQVTGEAPVERMDADVAFELHRLRVRAAAADAFRLENELSIPSFDDGTLGEILLRPPEPPMRIDGLVPSDAATLLVAMRKTGKTTLTLNVARALLTGEALLGRFAVRPITGTVAFLNFEVSAAMLARWADDHGLDHERFFLVNLRGRRNPLSHPKDRALLAARLRSRSVEVLVVDPFGRAFTGVGQNDAGEVGAFLADLDVFARTEVGVHDLFLTAHAGWTAEHSRGASALEDWPDSIITLSRDDQNERFLSAIGRDVEVEEDRLNFDPDTRTLSMSGEGARKQLADAHRHEETREEIVELLRNHPEGLSGTQMTIDLDRRDAAFTASRNSLVDDGLLIRSRRSGRGGGYLYVLLTEPSETPVEPP